MTYIAPGDFRTASLKWYTRGLALSTNEAPDPDLTSAIAAMSDRIDTETGDHFEPEPADDADPISIVLSATGGRRLHIPKRIRAVTLVETSRLDGTWVAESSSDYRVVQSLIGGVRQVQDQDYLEIPRGRWLSVGTAAWPSVATSFDSGVTSAGVWPSGALTVRVTGRFGWASTPERIKRAVALLVWDNFKPMNPNLRRADAWTTEAGSFRRAPSEPTGIPEVDEIIEEYSRNLGVAV